jgi:two-component system LytT family sensor kinase
VRRPIFPGATAFLGIAGIWVGIALIETVKTYAAQRGLPGARPRPFFDVAVYNLPWWGIWALLTGPITALAARLPIHDLRSRLRAVAVHVGAALFVAAVHVAATAAIYVRLYPRVVGAPNFSELATRWMNGFLIANLATYAGIAGVFYTVQYARRFRESQIAAVAMEAERERLRRQMVEARLHALQRELDPHFLFNTLNAIGALVRRQDSRGALHTLAQLGDLLRDALDRGRATESTLEAEMKTLRRYIDIEQTRFGDRLQVDTHVPEALYGMLIPTLSLQPLVENAIRHGVARTAGAGYVSIEAVERGGTLTIIIRNSGADRQSEGEEGIGLSNTRARLEQLYGDRAGLDLTIAADGEATATLRVPVHTTPVIDAQEQLT